MTGQNTNLAALSAAGVAVWLDDLSRERLRSGNLAELIATKSVVGVTTNPTIFASAVANGDAYDQQLRELAGQGADVEDIVRAFTTDDVRHACDVLRPVWAATGGRDGRVSLEVDPRLAHETDATVAQAIEHWIDPAVRYRRAWELLRPGGHLAFWSATHVFPDDGDPFFAEIQDIYDEIGETLPPGASRPRPGALPDDRAEIEDSGLFYDVVTRHFDWEISYTADEYLRLLDTFSGHIAMHPWQRDRLYSEIRRRLAQRPDGRLRRGWGAVLHVARRTGPEPTP